MTYKRIRTLGGGLNNSGVELLRDTRSNLYVVEKRLPDRKLFKRELAFLKSVREHPNCMHYGQFWDDKVPKLIVIYCDLGSWKDFIRRAREYRGPISQAIVYKCVEDITSALAFCHTGVNLTRGPRNSTAPRRWTSFVHCDVHEGNVFMTSVSQSIFPKFVLTDFGNCVSSVERRLTDRDYLEDLWMLAQWCVVEYYKQTQRTPHARINTLTRAMTTMRKGSQSSTIIFKMAVDFQADEYSVRSPPKILSPSLEPKAPERQPWNGHGWGRSSMCGRRSHHREHGGSLRDRGGVFPQPTRRGQYCDWAQSKYYVTGRWT